ncbi:MAG: hypothetical protein CUN57_03940, partial [Phototrophicales bacterium]
PVSQSVITMHGSGHESIVMSSQPNAFSGGVGVGSIGSGGRISFLIRPAECRLLVGWLVLLIKTIGYKHKSGTCKSEALHSGKCDWQRDFFREKGR